MVPIPVTLLAICVVHPFLLHQIDTVTRRCIQNCHGLCVVSTLSCIRKTGGIVHGARIGASRRACRNSTRNTGCSLGFKQERGIRTRAQSAYLIGQTFHRAVLLDLRILEERGKQGFGCGCIFRPRCKQFMFHRCVQPHCRDFRLILFILLSVLGLQLTDLLPQRVRITLGLSKGLQLTVALEQGRLCSGKLSCHEVIIGLADKALGQRRRDLAVHLIGIAIADDLFEPIVHCYSHPFRSFFIFWQQKSTVSYNTMLRIQFFVLQNIDLVEDGLTQPAFLIRFCIVIQTVQGQMVTNALLDQRSVLFG
nr:MAG TPA: hypothetical protein [Caudoviricetes sp.]